MTRLAACQCRRSPDACMRDATQEDLLCDLCRAGCAAVGWAPAGIPADQIPMTGHQAAPTTVWGE